MMRKLFDPRIPGLVLTCTVGLLTACSPAPGQEEWGHGKRSGEQFRQVRMERRAYDGSPPIIPHAVSKLGRENCLSCHQPGSSEGIAPPRSHPAWGDCRQCHVEKKIYERFRETSFAPLRWPSIGPRQSALAPPMIPHALQNRAQCATCHIGEQAHPALRARHGLRPNCQQCHVALIRELASTY